MTNATNILPILTTTSAYIIIVLYSNWLINKKIKEKTFRKKYKKYFNRHLGVVFAPFLFSVAMGSFLVSSRLPVSGIPLALFIMKRVSLLLCIILAVMNFPELRLAFKQLKNMSEEELLNESNYSAYL